MELQDAINIVKAGGLKERNLFELWEVEQVLQKSGDTDNLAKFRTEVTPDAMKAADAQATVEVSARQEELAKVKEGFVEDEAFKKGMDNFWNKVEIVNEPDTDKVEAAQLRAQIEDISVKEAEQAILEGSAKAQDYKTVLANRMSANCIQLVATSALVDMVAKGAKLSEQEANAKATETFENMFSDQSKEKVKISSKAAIGFLASKMQSLSNFGERLAQHTGLTAFVKQVKKTDEKLTKAYPKSYPFGKSLAKTGTIAILFGGTGIAVYSAVKMGQTIGKQRQDAEKAGLTHWQYLTKKENRAQAITLGMAVVSTAISITGMSAENMGLSGHLFSPKTAEDAAGTIAQEAAQSGFSFGSAWDNIKHTVTNGTFLARTSVATAGSGAIASIEYSKLADMKPGTPEHKAQKRKALHILGGSALGTVLGMTIAGAVGGMQGEHQVAPEHHDTPAEPATQADTEALSKLKTTFEPNKLFDNTSNTMPDNWKGVPYAADQVHDVADTAEVSGHHQSTQESVVDTAHDGTFSTSAQVQKFYEYRVSHINQYHPLVADKLASSFGGGMSGQEVVNQMLGRAESFVNLPEGITPERAVHSAVMAAQYKGDFSLAKVLNCPDEFTAEQQHSIVAKVVAQYNSEKGLPLGYPLGVKYDASIPFGGSSHVDDCHKMYNSSYRHQSTVSAETTTSTNTEVDTKVGGSEVVTGSKVVTPVFADQTVTTHQNVQYEAAFNANEYQAGNGTTEHTLHYRTFGKENIHVGDAGVKDIYVERDGERVVINEPSDLQRGDKLKVVYEHGTETVPAKKFAGFDTHVTPQEYSAYNDAAVAAEAKELGVEPNKLTKLESGDYVKVTKDGVVHIDTNVETGKAEVKLVDFDGKPMNAPAEVQTEAVNATVKELNDTNTDKVVTTVEKVKVGETITTNATSTSTEAASQTTTQTTGKVVVKSGGSYNASVRSALMSRGKI